MVRHLDDPGADGVEEYSHYSRKVPTRHYRAVARIRSAALVAPESTYFSPPAPWGRVVGSGVLEKFDAVNLHWVADFISPKDVREILLSGKPIVWTLHDAHAFTGGCHYPGTCSRYRHDCGVCPQLKAPFRTLASTGLAWQRTAFQSAPSATFVTPSAWLARLAATSPLLAGSRIEVIPNGLDLEVFKPEANKQRKSEIGWPSDAFVVLFGAHSLRDRRKGVDVILEAIDRCLEQEDVREMLASGKLVFACFGHAADFDSTTSLPISCLGPVASEEYMAGIYQSSDLYLCASREDNLPNTVMEAMACGLAVVGSRVGGIPEMIDDEQTGRLVPGDDAPAMASVMLELIRNKSIVRRMGSMGRRKCERDYSSSRQCDAYVRLFESMREQSRMTSGAVDFRSILGRHAAGLRSNFELKRCARRAVAPLDPARSRA